MIGRSFKSVAWVAAIGIAAITCYMFSMRVAEERTGLAELNAEIVRTESAIRSLRTELGTRGRVQQLEHWASADFGYAAPRPGQVADGEMRLATLELAPEQTAEPPVRLANVDVNATRPEPSRVVLASASAAAPRTAAPVRPRVADPVPTDQGLLHRAALARPLARPVPTSARATAAPTPRRSLLDPRTVRDLGERARTETSRPAVRTAVARPARTR